jgi:hypothetical protein
MFDNSTGIYHYNYRLELENVINAICNIAFDVGIQLDSIDFKGTKEIEYAKHLFKEEIFENLPIRKIDLDEKDSTEEFIYTKDDFFSEISNYYNKTIFNNQDITNYLKDSDLLMIDKGRTFFYSYSDSAKNRIVSAIQNGGILKDVINKIDNSKIRDSLKKINLFEHNAFYASTVKFEKLNIQPNLPFINFRLINIEKVKKELDEYDNYWINFKAYKKNYKIDLSANPEDYFLIRNIENDNVLGMLIGDCLLPYSNVDLLEYISDEYISEYFWLLFQYSYAEFSNKPQITNHLVIDFKARNKSIKLNQLLSNLKNNLYLDSKVIIESDFEQFFNNVILVDKLEYLKEYEFLLAENTNNTAVGIYSLEKKGTSYNLLHWLNHEGQDAVQHFNGNLNSAKKTKLSVITLKPEVCYYFLEKYFEDLLENILIVYGYNFMSNIKFNVKKEIYCEVDFLIYSNKKFYYIEAKTKLSKFYIEEFLKKSSKMIDKFTPILEKGIEIDFILLGGYSDSNVKDLQYFINAATEETKKGYNLKRENLITYPYYFKVPIPDIKGKEITCIAEPEYDKLTNLILEVCPK